MTWPGWDSVEGAGRWSDFYFWFGIVCLGLLAVSEVVSHRYATRKDELVAAAEKAKQQAAADAQTLHDNELEKIRKQLQEAEKQSAEAQKRADEAHEQSLPRRLSAEQKEKLTEALVPFKGQKVGVFCILGNSESKQFAQDLDAVFRAAGWDDGGGTGISQGIFSADPVGVQVAFNQADAEARRVPSSVGALIKTLMATGILKNNNLYLDPQVPGGEIRLNVGKKSS